MQAVVASHDHAAALTLLRAILRAWLGSPAREPLPEALQRQTAAELATLIRAADDQAVLPAFAGALEALGLLTALPGEIASIVRATFAANRQRNAAVRDALEETCLLLNGIGIVPILLKGANRLLDRLYPDPGWRFLIDLDLLIADGRAGEAHARLRAAGYSVRATAAPPHHLPVLGHARLPLVIELHHLALPPPADRLLPTAAMTSNAELGQLGGARVRIPSLHDQLVHLIGAVQIQDSHRLTGTAPLRELLEAALLARQLGPAGLASALDRFRRMGFGRSADVFAARLAATFCPELAPRLASGPVVALIHRWAELQERSGIAAALGRLQRLAGRYALDLRWLVSVPDYRARILADLGTMAFYRKTIAAVRGAWRQRRR